MDNMRQKLGSVISYVTRMIDGVFSWLKKYDKGVVLCTVIFCVGLVYCESVISYATYGTFF